MIKAAQSENELMSSWLVWLVCLFSLAPHHIHLWGEKVQTMKTDICWEALLVQREQRRSPESWRDSRNILFQKSRSSGTFPLGSDHRVSRVPRRGHHLGGCFHHRCWMISEFFHSSGGNSDTGHINKCLFAICPLIRNNRELELKKLVGLEVEHLRNHKNKSRFSDSKDRRGLKFLRTTI